MSSGLPETRLCVGFGPRIVDRQVGIAAVQEDDADAPWLTGLGGDPADDPVFFQALEKLLDGALGAPIGRG